MLLKRKYMNLWMKNTIKVSEVWYKFMIEVLILCLISTKKYKKFLSVTITNICCYKNYKKIFKKICHITYAFMIYILREIRK